MSINTFKSPPAKLSHKTSRPRTCFDLLRNMAERCDEAVPRPKHKKRSWKAPDKGRDETPKDSLVRAPRGASILEIDGSVLEGVRHVIVMKNEYFSCLGWSDFT